jgi:L-ascorbate metabolism protein UlaG (beta-lactamase superfamily)
VAAKPEGAVGITFLGHATVRIDLDGTSLLTDPILRALASGLVHRKPVRDVARVVDGLDAVLTFKEEH